jgi:TPR repeat protein
MMKNQVFQFFYKIILFSFLTCSFLISHQTTFSYEAEDSSINGNFSKGKSYFEGTLVPKDLKMAEFHFKKAANDENDVNAQLALGYIYLSGTREGEIPQNLTLAELYFKKAADNDDEEAQFILGQMYAFGMGNELPQDFEEAKIWLEKASAKDHPDALFLLGKMHQEGQGVPKDLLMAEALFKKASKLGNKRAQDALINMNSWFSFFTYYKYYKKIGKYLEEMQKKKNLYRAKVD